MVVIDVLRAFTTAAYAFASEASSVFLVADIESALKFKREHPLALAMGEDHGLRPDGFDFSNSPAALKEADVDGRVLVQRTSAGTGGAVAARSAERSWAANLVCASATAASVDKAKLGPPTYVITGCFEDALTITGDDDRLAAELIERARLGEPLQIEQTQERLLETYEAKRCMALPSEHSHPDDVLLASHVDAFDFAMEIVRTSDGLRLEKRQ